MKPQIIQTVSELRQAVKGFKTALVPTMGALHPGHLILVDEAKKKINESFSTLPLAPSPQGRGKEEGTSPQGRGKEKVSSQSEDSLLSPPPSGGRDGVGVPQTKVIVSIFVNPKQFGEGEDYTKYPRTVGEDLSKLEGRADIVYVPNVGEMYPDGFATTVSVEGGLTDCLCGKSRPGHFDGVATVVTKLFTQVMPDIALFGEKDYQQLLVIKRLAADLNLPIEIVGFPIVREKDGLALSSRNRYLTREEREIAPMIYKTLCEIRDKTTAGKPVLETIAKAKQNLLNYGFDKIDYLEMRRADNLELMTELNAPARLFVAILLGNCRLIDNIAINPMQ